MGYAHAQYAGLYSGLSSYDYTAADGTLIVFPGDKGKNPLQKGMVVRDLSADLFRIVDCARRSRKADFLCVSVLQSRFLLGNAFQR